LLRRFPPIPSATKKFERLYKVRTAVERVNARLKIFWGADDGNVTGSRRFHAKTGVLMIGGTLWVRRLLHPAGDRPRQRHPRQTEPGPDRVSSAGTD
jgi:hypothetical protein